MQPKDSYAAGACAGPIDHTRRLRSEIDRLQAENRNLAAALEFLASDGVTCKIPLDGGAFALVDAADFVELARYRWMVQHGDGALRYAYRLIGNGRDGPRTSVRMHRQIIGAPDGILIDHINRDGLDNRRCNLRFATDSQNAANTPLLRKRNTSGFRGVSWSKNAGKWHAQLSWEKRNHHLGYFTSPLRAAAAYNAKALEFFGEFAVLNDLSDKDVDT